MTIFGDTVVGYGPNWSHKQHLNDTFGMTLFGETDKKLDKGTFDGTS